MQVLFDDGSVVQLAEEEAAALYDELWLLAPQRGAISAAGKLAHALREPVSVRRLVLDAHEASVFALARANGLDPTP